MSGKLLTMQDVADKVGVGYRTVQRWQEKGLLNFIKLPQGVRIREEHLENWLDSRTKKSKKKTVSIPTP